jgi:hypothetical protein
METNIKLLGFSNQSFNGVPIDKRGFDLEYDGRYLDVNTFNNNNVYYTRLNNNDLIKLLNKPSSSMPLEERIANASYYSPQIDTALEPNEYITNGYITNEELDSIFTPAEIKKTIALSPMSIMPMHTRSMKKPYSSRKSHSLKSSTKKNNHKKKHVTIKSPKVSHIKSNKITKRSHKIKTTTAPRKSIKKTSHISVEPSPKSIQKTIY